MSQDAALDVDCAYLAALNGVGGDVSPMGDEVASDLDRSTAPPGLTLKASAGSTMFTPLTKVLPTEP